VSGNYLYISKQNTYGLGSCKILQMTEIGWRKCTVILNQNAIN